MLFIQTGVWILPESEKRKRSEGENFLKNFSESEAKRIKISKAKAKRSENFLSKAKKSEIFSLFFG